jgi:hypothetical protein
MESRHLAFFGLVVHANGRPLFCGTAGKATMITDYYRTCPNCRNLIPLDKGRLAEHYLNEEKMCLGSGKLGVFHDD